MCQRIYSRAIKSFNKDVNILSYQIFMYSYIHVDYTNMSTYLCSPHEYMNTYICV